MNEIITRDYYLSKVEPFINKDIIKVFVGQRRVGKSYLLRSLAQKFQSEKDSNVIFIDKERYEFDSITNYKELNEYVLPLLKKTKMNYLFIDEVQEIEEFQKSLRHFNSQKNVDVYCSGSNSKIFSGELATFLSGRYLEIKVFSLSYTEYLLFNNYTDNDDSLRKYLRFGGLPFLKNLRDSEVINFEYLNNIFSTILYKDIISRYNIRNVHFLENLVKFTADNVGNILSSNKISYYLKSQKLNISPQMVLNYLNYLQNAFLIYKVRRKDVAGKKIFEIGEKYFFEDWGIRNAIIGYRQNDINKIIENVVYIHLIINGFDVYVGKLGEKEIDFVCEKNGEKIYIQVAYLIPDEQVKEREFGNLLEIKDNWRKLVVSLDTFPIGKWNGIEHYNLREFLTSFR